MPSLAYALADEMPNEITSLGHNCCPVALLEQSQVSWMVFVLVVVDKQFGELAHSLLVEIPEPDLGELVVGQDQFSQLAPAPQGQVLDASVVDVVAG